MHAVSCCFIWQGCQQRSLWLQVKQISGVARKGSKGKKPAGLAGKKAQGPIYVAHRMQSVLYECGPHFGCAQGLNCPYAVTQRVRKDVTWMATKKLSSLPSGFGAVPAAMHMVAHKRMRNDSLYCQGKAARYASSAQHLVRAWHLSCSALMEASVVSQKPRKNECLQNKAATASCFASCSLQSPPACFAIL